MSALPAWCRTKVLHMAGKFLIKSRHGTSYYFGGEFPTLLNTSSDGEYMCNHWRRVTAALQSFEVERLQLKPTQSFTT